jgi:hypothetical protein
MLACRLLRYNFRYDTPTKKAITLQQKIVGGDPHKLRTLAALTGSFRACDRSVDRPPMQPWLRSGEARHGQDVGISKEFAIPISTVLRKNYRRDLKRARLTNLKEETGNKRHPSMMKFCSLWLNLFGDLLHFLVLSLRSKSSLAAENLFLRKQLAFYQERKIKPRRTSHPARLALLWLSRWFNWRSALTVVTPKTFVGWHRKGFQLFWRRKCQSGRPRIPPELQRLIRKMARENLSVANR